MKKNILLYIFIMLQVISTYSDNELTANKNNISQSIKTADDSSNMQNWETLLEEAIEYRNKNDYDTALKKGRDALILAENALGKDHADLTKILAVLVGVNSIKGQYSEAEQLCKRTIEILEKNSLTETKDTAASYNTLSNIYFHQKKFSEAETSCAKALMIREKIYGKEHPDIAECFNNLATIYYYQDKLNEAKTLFEKALNMWKKFLGPEHPNVIKCQNNINALEQDTINEEPIDANDILNKIFQSIQKLSTDYKNKANP